jgi:hypothetical protein
MRIQYYIGALLLLGGAAWAQNQAAPATGNATPAATKPAAASTPAPANAALSELKTQIYKGTLLDAACAGGGAQSSTPAATNSSPAAANQSQGCSVSANTKEFALKTNSGQTYRFDSVGNERTEQAIKNKKKWNDLASAGKPIHARVSANLSGDRLTVVSIN